MSTPSTAASPDAKKQGVVKWFDADDKGFGFITPDVPTPSGRDVFVHASAVRRSGLKTLDKGQKVSYEMGENKGKPVAINIAVVK